jgi:hypothetical protein
VNRSVVCGIAAGACLAAGFAAYIAAGQYASVCTAIDASGRRLVIGTELNEAGRRYKLANPADTNNDILESLAGRGPEAAWTRESIASCTRRLAISNIARTVAFPLAGLFTLLAVLMLPRSKAPAPPKRGTVFLSYNHADADAAAKLRAALHSHSIPVLIDSEAIRPGERIRDFIERSLHDSETVLSLVSSRSLLSAWVALETIQALQRNQWIGGRQFIACYLDDAFFDPECRLTLTRQIDDRLRRIEQLLPEHAASRIDTRDLDEEKTRLYDLRNNLGLILETLKSTLCLDLRNDRFDESITRLITALRNNR